MTWINSNNQSDAGCEANLVEQINLVDLKQGSTYSLCFLHSTDNITYMPRTCTGITIPVEWSERAWMKNKSIIPIVSTLGVSLIVAALLSASVAYVCIRNHPKLIKGSKKVVIIKGTNKSRNIEMPKQIETRPAYISPSIITYEQSYLTPNYDNYARVKHRPPIHRNIAEYHQSNENDIYIEANAPSRFQLETWRMNSRKRPPINNVHRFGEIYEYDEIPPPVPGNHPYNYGPRTPNVIYSDNFYSSA